MKRILGSMRRAIQDYNMIQPGDRIVVGVSGGKDSMALLHSLNLYRRFSPVPFELGAITVDLGFEDVDYTSISEYCKENDIPYYIKRTDIGKIVFDIRKEKSPCALCSNLKRGALHKEAKLHGYNKVALGHHSNDVVETFFMSLFYESRLNCFAPVTYLDRSELTVIRPFIYIKEKDIKFNQTLKELPVIKSNCPADGITKRAEVKDLIRSLQKTYPDLIDRVLKAISNKEQLHLWFS